MRHEPCRMALKAIWSCGQHLRESELPPTGKLQLFSDLHKSTPHSFGLACIVDARSKRMSAEATESLLRIHWEGVVPARRSFGPHPGDAGAQSRNRRLGYAARTRVASISSDGATAPPAWVGFPTASLRLHSGMMPKNASA